MWRVKVIKKTCVGRGGWTVQVSLLSLAAQDWLTYIINDNTVPPPPPSWEGAPDMSTALQPPTNHDPMPTIDCSCRHSTR